MASGIARLSGKSTLYVKSNPVAYCCAAPYGGDSNFTTSSTSPSSQSVSQASTTTTVTSSAAPAVWGQPVTVTAVTPGSGTPTGTVSFKDGSTTLGTGSLSGGTASLTLSTLAVGAHAITAAYAGDVNFTASSGSLSQTVNKAATTTIAAASPSPSTSGQSVTFTATVTPTAPGAGTPTGSVTFTDGSTTLGTAPLDAAGQATFRTALLPPGSQQITAVYGGDDDFAAADYAALDQEVDADPATTTTLSSSNSTASYGQAVTLTATVGIQPPATGMVNGGSFSFYDNGSLLSTVNLVTLTNQATYTTSAFAVGSHALTAAYSGNTSGGVTYTAAHRPR